VQERNTPHIEENASMLKTDAISRLFENASVDASSRSKERLINRDKGYQHALAKTTSTHR
jgi:hypothetical protein